MLTKIWCWLIGHKRVEREEHPHPEGEGKITFYYLALFCVRCGCKFTKQERGE